MPYSNITEFHITIQKYRQFYTYIPKYYDPTAAPSVESHAREKFYVKETRTALEHCPKVCPTFTFTPFMFSEQ